MALTTIEGRYTNGKIELNEHPRNIKTARVIVIFIEDETNQAQQEQERQAAIERMFAAMHSGIRSDTGGPYYDDREELYAERTAQLERHSKRKEAIARVMARMHSGIGSKTGGPYYTDREEIYAERTAQLERRSGR